MSRIFCVGRNYRDHAKELGNEVPSKPIIFIKPMTAIQTLVSHQETTIYIPQHLGEVHYEAELVILFSGDKNAGYVGIQGITLGLDLTLREKQFALKQKGLPWEAAKSFDGSAPLGPWIPIQNLDNIYFTLELDQQQAQLGHIQNQIFSVETVMTSIESWTKIQAGDMLMTGTPKGVGPLHAGQKGQLRLFQDETIILELRFTVEYAPST
jgi:2-keto-4-pentenoate hydratase/2-oxohepta-3-ene-1,7-dioic acid hydratase in catechol pathway